MASIVVVSKAAVAALFPLDNGTRIRNRKLFAAVTAGASLYQRSDGKLDKTSANTAGKEQFRGIALSDGGAGDTISVLEEGEIGGFDLTGINPDALVYVQDTAGEIGGTVSGTKTVPIGRVVCLTDRANTKVLRVSVNQLANY